MMASCINLDLVFTMIAYHNLRQEGTLGTRPVDLTPVYI